MYMHIKKHYRGIGTFSIDVCSKKPLVKNNAARKTE